MQKRVNNNHYARGTVKSILSGLKITLLKRSVIKLLDWLKLVSSDSTEVNKPGEFITDFTNYAKSVWEELP